MEGRGAVLKEEVTTVTVVCDVDGVRDSQKPVRELEIRIGEKVYDKDLCGDCEAQLALAIAGALIPLPERNQESPDPTTGVPDVEHIDGAKDPYDREACIAWAKEHGYVIGTNKYIPVDARAHYLRDHPHIERPEKW
jgi:hypothetical protein